MLIVEIFNQAKTSGINQPEQLTLSQAEKLFDKLSKKRDRIEKQLDSYLSTPEQMLTIDDVNNERRLFRKKEHLDQILTKIINTYPEIFVSNID